MTYQKIPTQNSSLLKLCLCSFKCGFKIISGKMSFQYVLQDLHAKLLQSCPILCNPMDYSPPSSSVHGILQARRLEWAAMPCSRGSSRPKYQTRVSYVSCIGRRVLYHQHHMGSPYKILVVFKLPSDSIPHQTGPSGLK